MAEVVERNRLEEVVRNYRVPDGFAEDLRTALAANKQDRERAQRTYDLIGSLSGRAGAQRRASVQGIHANLWRAHQPPRR